MPATASILTADQIALQAHIEARNAETQKWVDEAPGRWAGMLVSDPTHWAEYGIFSVAELERYETVNLAYELHKDRYGFKPNYGELKQMSDEELNAMIDRLSAMPIDEPEFSESADPFIW